MTSKARLRGPPPEPTWVSKPYWEAAREGALSIQRCGTRGQLFFHPRNLCLRCGGAKLAWEQVSGLATVHAFTVVRRPTLPQEEVPYVIAIVELDEGPRMTTNIVGCEPDAVRIGMRVAATFEAATEEITLVKFRPAEEGYFD